MFRGAAAVARQSGRNQQGPGYLKQRQHVAWPDFKAARRHASQGPRLAAWHTLLQGNRHAGQ
jgi:hypothetical protein